MIIKENSTILSGKNDVGYQIICYEDTPQPNILVYALHRQVLKPIGDDECFVFSQHGNFLGVAKLEELPFKLVESYNSVCLGFDVITTIRFEKNQVNNPIAYKYVAADISKLEDYD